MKIIISNRSAEPIYEQIKSQIKEAIFSGDLKENDLLPSIRQLAKDLKISVITTTRAYSDLEEEGFIFSVQGKGSFVLPKNKEMARENVLHKIEQNLTDAIEIANLGGVTKEDVLRLINILYMELDNE
jgi:GntR family transcriptional regulator